MSFEVNILYFASVREAMGCSEEKIELPSSKVCVSELVDLLVAQNKRFREAQNAGVARLLVAVNQELATDATVVREGDEVAFFPPMTGG
ncbi:MAG: molybdopterin converting factor subunit 1 [Deltaproteobacteria bacterium]|jgi:molybdopterin synthase sulfur carrier subunit|nr:molybdopterin converting factor subunit 1 [Gammaproteobacteria bacterium]MBP80146.1 molybdopterin converting factor subunit 1 [Deltaproteobacteria bacterium]|tara:strand:- start:151 stop:417 length:267 start_codon:yes stop_codon:yes gene_type:complete